MTGSDRITWRDSRGNLPEGGEAVYDSLAETRGRVYGPFPVLLNHPELARRVGDLGTLIRYEGKLPDADLDRRSDGDDRILKRPAFLDGLQRQQHPLWALLDRTFHRRG
jgi:hypothetical protein